MQDLVFSAKEIGGSDFFKHGKPSRGKRCERSETTPASEQLALRGSDETRAIEGEARLRSFVGPKLDVKRGERQPATANDGRPTRRLVLGRAARQSRVSV